MILSDVKSALEYDFLSQHFFSSGWFFSDHWSPALRRHFFRKKHHFGWFPSQELLDHFPHLIQIIIKLKSGTTRVFFLQLDNIWVKLIVEIWIKYLHSFSSNQQKQRKNASKCWHFTIKTFYLAHSFNASETVMPVLWKLTHTVGSTSTYAALSQHCWVL